jgi:hypothetical protein
MPSRGPRSVTGSPRRFEPFVNPAATPPLVRIEILRVAEHGDGWGASPSSEKRSPQGRSLQ